MFVCVQITTSTLEEKPQQMIKNYALPFVFHVTIPTFYDIVGKQ